MSNRTVLLIAYHFPPIQGSSGVQRTLRFAQYLPKYGWSPIVLTVHPRAYEHRNPAANGVLDGDLEVYRAFGLDTARHLSVMGRYPRRLALPDRWASWGYFALRKAIGIVQERRVQAVMSTFPIATAHWVGLRVAQRTGLPWVAEFRDPMWQGDYPPDPQLNQYWRDLERQVVNQASATVVVTPGALRNYANRFPSSAVARLQLIENGYDDSEFRTAEAEVRTEVSRGSRLSRPTTLLHSGVIYPSERDPSHFFSAISSLRKKGLAGPSTLKILLRASGSTSLYQRMLVELRIDDMVDLLGALSYKEALKEMLTVDGLILLQASNCNDQIPAKAYEYLRAGKPVLALTDPNGDTANLIRSTSAGTVARLDSATEIEAALGQLISNLAAKHTQHECTVDLTRYSRAYQTGQLAQTLDELVGERSLDH